MSCACVDQRSVELAGAPVIAGDSGLPPSDRTLPPEKTWTWPVVPAPATYSAAGIPIRSIRHSSVSADPVETAMSGMLSFVSPAVTVPGKVSDLSGCAFAAHWATLTVTWRRHFPIWRPSGTLAPTGTLFSVKLPSMPVVVFVREPLWKSAPHEQASFPVGTPLGSGVSGTAGGETAALYGAV